MENKINLFIPIEIKRRDFPSRALLALEASNSNFNVFIGRKLEVDRLVFRKKPGIYFGLVTTQAYSNFYKKLRKYGHIIFVNDEEGLVTFSDQMYFNLKVSNNTLQYINLLFLWSKTHKEMFERKFPKYNKFKVSGSPRFDLSKSGYIGIFDNDRKIIYSKYKKYILICCSFSFNNYFEKNINYLDILRKQKVIRNHTDEKKYLKYLKYNKEALNQFLDAIPILSKSFPDLDIIIRPHPSENNKIYLDISNNYHNVYVESRFSIHSWILNSMCIVHNYCTSSAEALSLNIPRFALRKSFDNEVHKSIPYEISDICENVNSLVLKIKKLKDKNEYRNNNDIMNFKKYLHNIDQETFAYKIIIESIKKYLNKKNKIKINYISYFYLKLVFLIKSLKRYFLNYKTINNSYIKHKVDKIDKKDILDLFKIFLINSSSYNLKNYSINNHIKNVVNIYFND